MGGGVLRRKESKEARLLLLKALVDSRSDSSSRAVVGDSVWEVDHHAVELLCEGEHARQAARVCDLIRVPDRCQQRHLLLHARRALRHPFFWDQHMVVPQLRPFPKQILRPPLAVHFEHWVPHDLVSDVDLTPKQEQKDVSVSKDEKKETLPVIHNSRRGLPQDQRRESEDC